MKKDTMKTVTVKAVSLIDDDVREMEICVDRPRLIKIMCISRRDNRSTERHLKVTEKGKVALL